MQAIGGFQKHSPLSLNRAIRHGTVDRTWCGQIRFQKQILQLAILDQCCRLMFPHMVQKDLTSFHHFAPNVEMPAAFNSA
jgi:hypothetical protein